MRRFPPESNVIVKDTRRVEVLFGLCYPSTYRAGMTGLAIHLFYSLLNLRDDTSCERYFRFDTPSPVLSIESGRHLRKNHIVGFSLTYETDIVHLIQMLEMAGIPATGSERGEEDPVVLVGGPAVSANPTPFSQFVDIFVIGEGDLVVHDLIDIVRDCETRQDVLEEAAALTGVYVPSRTQGRVKRLRVDDIESLFHPTHQIIPDVPDGDRLEPVFGKAFLVEVTRGCGHSCKFCLVGHIRGGKRARSLERLQDIITTGIAATSVKKVALIGSSLGDMPHLEELASWIVDNGLELSVPSLRADTVTEGLLRSIVKGGQRTLTIAPETGSERLRRAIGKGLSDEDIIQAVEMASASGIKSVKLYFIIGLPGEDDEDLVAIGDLVHNLTSHSRLRLTVALNPFVPKAHTRFEREPQPPLGEIRRRTDIVRRTLWRLSLIHI